MSDIRTYNDLLEEKKRLEEALVIQKDIIRQDLIELREELRPVLDLVSMVVKIPSRNQDNPLIGMGINLVGEVVLGSLVLSRGTKIARIIVPFLVKKASTFFLNKGRGTFFQKLAGIWKKNRSNGHTAE